MTKNGDRGSAVPSAAAVTELAPAIRVAVRAEGVPATDVDDLVQETLTRLLEVRTRLDPSTAAGYAVATARNLARSRRRSEEVAHRHRHRLHDPSAPADPLAVTLTAEERQAVRAAVAALPESVRADLLSTAGGNPAHPAEVARRARLARARALVRVEYVVALRRVELPTPRCRGVLTSISARDRRRQLALGAGEHLLTCPPCGSLAEPLAERRRALAGLVPVPLVAWVIARRPRAAHATAALGSAGVLTVGVLAGVGVAAHPGQAQPAAAAVPAAAPIVLVAPHPVASVHFASGSAVLDAGAHRSVETVAAEIRSRGLTAASVTGYADDTAGEALNRRLSLQRAQAVARSLEQLLGPGVRVTCTGAATADPVASESTAGGRAQDRRAVIALL